MVEVKFSDHDGLIFAAMIVPVEEATSYVRFAQLMGYAITLELRR